jgi:hypothetical protein
LDDGENPERFDVVLKISENNWHKKRPPYAKGGL